MSGSMASQQLADGQLPTPFLQSEAGRVTNQAEIDFRRKRGPSPDGPLFGKCLAVSCRIGSRFVRQSLPGQHTTPFRKLKLYWRLADS